MTDFRSGFITILGKPNVGKSTLMNVLLGHKIAAVSPRPQTTRRRQLGILTTEKAQLIFVDTPGIHKPLHKLGEFLNQEAEEALEEVDVVLFLVDASQPPDDEDRRVAALLGHLKHPPSYLIGLNKIDLVSGEDLEARQTLYRSLLPEAPLLAFSAVSGQGLDRLLQALAERLPIAPPQYPEDQLTDLYEREIAADLIREAALLLLRDEVPHAIAVRIDEFKERSDSLAYIRATLFVERESQKAIVIGQDGQMLKKIGIHARQEIEAMSGRKVYLELRVKVEKNWREREDILRRFGYKLKRR
ncbi:MAG: GTPase Era [Anaerolineales bacterium]|nr:GTPase Era [Anaerolineales bacterium]MCX7609116.1 GTPase Era [Anaerolineales bacterium]MDW8227090.1 GTPase Era [Anaerolineales bacterium]